MRGYRISIEAIRTPVPSIVFYVMLENFLSNLSFNKSILNYGIKRKSTRNHIVYNNLFNNKTANTLNL